jgi:hypothetical protein
MKEEEDVLKSDEEDSRCIIGNMYICIWKNNANTRRKMNNSATKGNLIE